VPIDDLRREELRGRIACVLQDDQLFSGTIAENIAFFEPAFSRERVVEVAKMTQIHAEIMAMPLRYETRVIDLGASLSGGQRQRLLLARALYRDPRVLVLDEASSHLDLANERLVNQAISKLRITRIIIAHRPETLAIADRVLQLQAGKLEQIAGSDRDRPKAAVPA
jgi:ATP-binding cassette subfamily B protein RaxB